MNTLFNRLVSAPSKLINGYLPRKVEPVAPVQPILDVPSFMKRNTPVTPRTGGADTDGDRFAKILAEAERIVRS